MSSEKLNPYQPPQSQVADTPPDSPLTDADKGRRFGTLVVDYIGFILLSFVVGVILGAAFGSRGGAIMAKIPGLVFGAAVVFAYYMFFEGIWGRTPGKFAFGTRVVAESGGPPSTMAIVKRTLCRFIPFEAFTFFGERGLHDRLSDTRVVLTRN